MQTDHRVARLFLLPLYRPPYLRGTQDDERHARKVMVDERRARHQHPGQVLRQKADGEEGQRPIHRAIVPVADERGDALL